MGRRRAKFLQQSTRLNETFRLSVVAAWLAPLHAANVSHSASLPPSLLCRSLEIMWDSPGGGKLSRGEQKVFVVAKLAEIVVIQSRIIDLSSNLCDLMWLDVQPTSEVVWNVSFKLFFDDVKHFHFLLAFTLTTPNKTVESFSNTERNVLGSQSKEAQMTKPLFNSWLTPWKSFSWSPPQCGWGSSLHVFRSYREVGGSPPVQCVAPLVEVLALLKQEKCSFQKVQLLKNDLLNV